MKNIQLIRVVILLFTLVLFNACDEAVEPIDPQLIENIETPNPDCLSPTNISGAFTSSTNVTLTWTPADGESSWQIQYGVSGFDLGSGSLTNATSNTTLISNLVSTNSYDFYIRSVCSSEEFGSWWGPFTIVPPNPNCLTPSGLTVVRNPGNTSATVNWTAGGTETSWQVLYVAAGFSPSVGITLPATSKPFTVSNLTNESYDFYVRAKCSDNEFSSWSTKVNLAEVSTGGNGYYLRMKVDGVLVNFPYPETIETASYNDSSFTIITTGGINSFFLQVLSPDGVGTYELNFAEVICSYSQGFTIFSSDYDDLTNSPGNVVITELIQSQNTIKGTFNFIGKSDGMTQTRTITEGEFYLPY